MQRAAIPEMRHDEHQIPQWNQQTFWKPIDRSTESPLQDVAKRPATGGAFDPTPTLQKL